MANYNDRFRLNTVGFMPTVFTGIEYKQELPDFNIANASAKIRADWERESTDTATAVDLALQEIENKLYKTEKLNAWWADYKQKVKDNIDKARMAGDFYGAINIAKREVGRIKSDTALNGRLEASDNYRNWENDINERAKKGEITQDTANYFKNKYTFDYKDSQEENGLITTGDVYNNLPTPVPDVPIEQITLEAFKFITPSKPLSSNYKTIRTDGTSIQETLEYIDEKDILNNLEALFRQNGKYKDALKQRYDVQGAKYDELKYKVDNGIATNDEKYEYKLLGEVFEQNLGKADFEHFAARTIGHSAITQNLAYSYHTKAEDLETTANKHKGLGLDTETGNGGGYSTETPGGSTEANGQPSLIPDLNLSGYTMTGTYNPFK